MITIHNPYDGSAIGQVAEATPADVAAAVQRAARARREARHLAIDRHEVLYGVHARLKARQAEFAGLICRETGKPIREARNEVARALTTLMWSAEESLRLDGVVQPCDTTPQHLPRQAYAHRVPLGVVVAITPFNFPVNIPAHKVGPAYAAGNAVILKPSPRAPLSSARLVDLFAEAGAAAGMVQVLHGEAGVVERLTRSDVQAVTFTGGSRAGRKVAEWAAGKKLVMELGASDPIIVMDDADVEAAATAIVQHRFGFSGQRCTSCKRAFVHAAVYGAVRDRVVAAADSLVVGDPALEETDIGPLISADTARELLEWVEQACAAGARLLCDGTRQGAVVAPTVLEDVPAGHPLRCEEVFGPVLPLVRFEALETCLEMVNASRYGLQAGLFTRRIDVVQEVFEKLETGALIVNEGPGLRVEPIPFGGVKQSGFGREGVPHAVKEFTTLKTLVL